MPNYYDAEYASDILDNTVYINILDEESGLSLYHGAYPLNGITPDSDGEILLDAPIDSPSEDMVTFVIYQGIEGIRLYEMSITRDTKNESGIEVQGGSSYIEFRQAINFSSNVPIIVTEWTPWATSIDVHMDSYVRVGASDGPRAYIFQVRTDGTMPESIVRTGVMKISAYTYFRVAWGGDVDLVFNGNNDS